MASSLDGTSLSVSEVVANKVSCSNYWGTLYNGGDVSIGKNNPRLPNIRVGAVGFVNATGAGGTYATVLVPSTGTYIVFAVADTPTSSVKLKVTYSFKNLVYIGIFSDGTSTGITKLNAYHEFIYFRVS